ncbi:acyl-phosphate glycerol 3-phosphate acyltransferase [Oribacterium sp. C9]|uniref:glycerol-3-phosphate acyltransferase n=1 Tax=Oribacterium sp. C9 TaxID=1943579 RepID=UPI00098FC43E|nr:glycerol-3-phosphate acyltransferase [Oribacterium sp. C9]OON86046.1 acyl-phosphate glycerol 3-phosphate acyltransferase [Oribacterium sp. C9]
MDIQHIIIALLVGYVFGMIPNGYLYGKAQGVDIYKVGSGNPGSTNISRTLGKRAGATVLLLDMAKTIVPILILSMIWKPATVDETTLIILWGGTGAVLGHDFPVLPKLKGGKGIACSGALVIAFEWKLALILVLVFVVVVKTTGYVSVGSITAAVMLFVFTVLFGYFGMLPMSMGIYPMVCALIFFLSVLAIWQHRSNIDRLRKGTESKFHFKK